MSAFLPPSPDEDDHDMIISALLFSERLRNKHHVDGTSFFLCMVVLLQQVLG
jgi:hypothetical protein